MVAPLYLKCTVNSQCVCPQTALTFRCPCKYNAPTKYVIILEVGLFIALRVLCLKLRTTGELPFCWVTSDVRADCFSSSLNNMSTVQSQSGLQLS